mmetsp:Transcript_51882/g.91140  ORF Transcript_51882/g.91140 Transcript_51882/m.91140 type:complete len:425 (+) Transcript_51882:62-1336(+)
MLHHGAPEGLGGAVGDGGDGTCAQVQGKPEPSAGSGNTFLHATAERHDLNQYWFSTRTIRAFVDEITDVGGSAALVSSPSVYFSLPEAVRQRSKVLDFDKQWSSDPGYVFYDFNEPESVPAELHGTFDFVLVDPPFITREVWAQYATTVKLLLRPNTGRILCTTIAENAKMMQDFLGLQPVRFRPSIPTLVYQYSVYTNYVSNRLDALNPEVDDEDWMVAERNSQCEVQREPSKGKLDDDVLAASVQCRPAQPAPAPWPCEEGPAESLPPSPEVVVLNELRNRLNQMKRATEAINAPLQTAIRRRQAGGEVAASAAAKAEAALDTAEAASLELATWLRESGAEVGSALGDSPEAFAQSLEQDRWRTQAVASIVARARGDRLPTMAAYSDFALTSKQHSAAVFRLSNVVLDRIKALKRQAAEKTG